jgi:hypothetical protein
MSQLYFWNPKVEQLFSIWMNLCQWRPFNIFDVLLEAEAKKQFRIKERSW